jgi:hemoglobin/transferrin/lactoferrin receptor protein
MLFALLTLPSISYAQGLPIKVLNAQSKEPLMFVNIVNEDGTFGITTDETGTAKIRGIALDEKLTFSYVGFRDRILTLKEIIANEDTVLMQDISFTLGITDIVVSSRSAERRADIANQVSVIDAKKIALLNPQNSADLLQASGVFVQRSQMGGGSPIIRGFEANKLLIVIDGVRLNNAIYRNGHLQNVITIDNAVLDRTEIVQGPSSVIYGSDALGGVMHFVTKEPQLALQKTQDEIFGGSAYARYSTANNERAVHLDFNYGTRKLALLTSVTYSDFSDLRVGANGMDDYPGFGQKHFYVSRASLNGETFDSIFTNPNPLIQKFTGYRQLDALQKVKYQYSDELGITLNFQYSTTNDVPRFDQLNEFDIVEGDTPADNDTIPKFATWNYGPQNRLFLSAKARFLPKDNEYMDEADIILSYQKVDEDRIKRRYRKDWEENQEEDVHVIALNADAVKIFNPRKNQKLLYGAEFIYNKVNSNAFNRNVESGIIDTRALTRYPNGGSFMASGAFYLNYRQNITDKLSIMAGTRYTYTFLNSQFRTDSLLLPLPFDEITINNGALTGSVSASYKFADGWYLDAVAATAFRSPNVDDYGKIRSKGGYVTFPNDSLTSEKSLNAEVSLTKQIGNTFLISGTYFYTYLFDAIVRDYFSFEGENLFFIDGSFDTIQANVNAGQAFINGFSASTQFNLLKNLSLKSSFNWVKGVNVTEDEPLGHIPPAYGQTSLSYETNKMELTFLTRYNGWKRLADYAPGSSDNLEFATPDGTPAWIIYNAYVKYAINPKITLNFAVENILDTHYRPFSSGVSAPGRNFILTVRNSF